jgi:cyclase
MYRPRIIPVLLLKNNHLVKTVGFSNPKYIGDPINAVKLFNELKADELVFLDIDATTANRGIDLNLIREIGEEADMPFSVGGGIRNLEHIRDIIAAGAERAIIGAYAAENPEFIIDASKSFGTSTISVCIDVKTTFWGKQKVHFRNGKKNAAIDPEEFATMMQNNGAGELIIQSIDKDGKMSGYDLDLIEKISKAVSIPIVALGGAGSINDLKKAWHQAKANGLAAGSLFVYQGTKKGVLINYPDKKDFPLT